MRRAFVSSDSAPPYRHFSDDRAFLSVHRVYKYRTIRVGV
jgi:hypothetical protein